MTVGDNILLRCTGLQFEHTGNSATGPNNPFYQDPAGRQSNQNSVRVEARDVLGSLCRLYE